MTPPPDPSGTARDAAFSLDAQGRPFSPLYGDVFRSREGAAGEARTVFVDGCGLPARWAGASAHTIVELGFGLGVNFLETLRAWRRAPERPPRLDYVSIERHLLSPEQMRVAHEAIGLCDPDAAALRERLPVALPGLHRIAFDAGRVTLTLAIGDARVLVPRLVPGVDSFYLDGFAPARNPEMWGGELVRGLARLARPGAMLATYSAAAQVRDALASAGFEPHVLDGFGAKRHRIVARYAPRWRTYPPPPPVPRWPSRDAIVVGAGLAGSAIALALARRGWRVELLERRAGPATEGSAQPALADHLHVAPDDNPTARLTRAALLRSRADVGGIRWRDDPAEFSGRLVLAGGAHDAARQADLCARLDAPSDWIRALDADAASAVAGLRIAHGALWMPMCGAADPHASVRRWIDAGGDALRVRAGVVVDRLERDGTTWRAHGPGGAPIAQAPVVVLAAAGESARLARCATLAMRRVRGQSTMLAPGALGPLRAVLGGDAYACALPAGGTLIGSTFDDGEDLAPDPEADASNLRRLARMLELDAEALARGAASGPAGHRWTARDRLPLVGPLPDEDAARALADELARNDRLPLPRQPGLYTACGFGSRGLLWSVLAAEVLADAIDGGVAPVEADLLDAVDPARFLRQRVRRRRAF